MELLYNNINWLAVALGAVLSFGLGGFWYSSKLFGKGWSEGSNIAPVKGHPAPALAVQATGTFMLAWLIGIAEAVSEWWVAGLIVLTAATILAGGCMFSQKSRYAVLVEFSFVIVNGLIMALCHLIL